MLPWNYPVPAILYKYLPPERFPVLTDCRVRFSQRKAFNDDHELQPEYASFGTESEVWRYAIEIGFPLMRNGIPAAVMVKMIVEDPAKQKLALETLQRSTKVADELGSFCLTELAHSDRMWAEYASEGKGFVVGFATTHPSFGLLKGRGHLGKISYSDEPFGSALATILEREGAGVMFRKRLKYAFENEWRIIRMLNRLEKRDENVFLSEFDPASVCELLIRPDCAVETDLRRLATTDPRYHHLSIHVQRADNAPGDLGKQELP